MLESITAGTGWWGWVLLHCYCSYEGRPSLVHAPVLWPGYDHRLLKSGNVSTYVCSVYMDIMHKGANLFPDTLVPLLLSSHQRQHCVIIGMDSKAHSVMWGPDSNALGEVIEDLLVTHGLVLENRGFEPTFTARGISTHIDITLSLNCCLLYTS